MSAFVLIRPQTSRPLNNRGDFVMKGYRSIGSICVRLLIIFVALAATAGCASLPADRGTANIDKMMVARGAPVPAWSKDAAATGPDDGRAGELLSQPLTAERAVELAFLRNAQIREAYAELGFAQADVVEASRLSNPRIGYINLRPSDGGASQITRSVALNFTDVLLLSARTRLARSEFERVYQSVGAALLDLAARVEMAWFEYASAQQVAEMREAVAQTGENSAEFAQRLRDAGNITPRALALELAAASEARVVAGRTKAEAIRLRMALAELLGVSTRESWQIAKRLPAPLVTEDPQPKLIDDALAARLDVAAARREVNVLESALGLTRRWRWLGEVEVGYERESETDGARLKGPTLSMEVPIFNQNRHGLLRAQAGLEAARARLSALELGVRNEVALGLDHLASAREITEAYRTALVPQREAVVQHTQEEFNFMLVGAFELLQAKREEFNAYQEYLEAVRDYWITRTELKRAAGGRLPGDGEPPQSTIGVEDILVPKEEQMKDMDHSQMNHNTPPPADEKGTPAERKPQPDPPEQHHDHGSQSRSTEGDQP